MRSRVRSMSEKVVESVFLLSIFVVVGDTSVGTRWLLVG